MTSTVDWGNGEPCPQDDQSGGYTFACEAVTRYLKIKNIRFADIAIVQIMLFGAKYTDEPDKCYMFQDGSAVVQQ